MAKKIEISTLNISVRVLMLDNKRFTKAVYNQLPKRDIDPENDDATLEYDIETYPNAGYSIIGWVKDDNDKTTSDEDYSLLLNKDGELNRLIFPNWTVDVRRMHRFKGSNRERAEWRAYYLSHYDQIFISC